MFDRWISFLLLLMLSIVGRTNASSASLSARSFNAIAATVEDTYASVKRYQQEAAIHKRGASHGNVTLDRSWDGAVLLKIGGSQKLSSSNATTTTVTESVKIVCAHCYVKGLAKAELQYPDNFNLSNALIQTAEAVNDTLVKAIDVVENNFLADLHAVEDSISNDWKTLSWNAIDFPPPQMNVSFNASIPAISEVGLKFEIDGLDIYLELDTSFGAGLTYDINLFASETPIGLTVGDDKVGVTASIDLLLNVDAEIDMSSGFHLKFEDGLGFDIALFDSKIAKLVHNGGQYEFLPITVELKDVVMSATLRLALYTGVQWHKPRWFPDDLELLGTSLSLSAGIGANVYANVAKLVSNVTYDPRKQGCKLEAIQEYSMGLGAAAGATVVADSHTWGPVAKTDINIWTTTLASLCVTRTASSHISSSSSATSVAVLKRETLSPTTTTSTITYTGVRCQSTIAGNCPASLQVTTHAVETTLLSAMVSSGAGFTWPKTPGVAAAVPTTIQFGTNASKLARTSGSPSEYTASSNINDIQSVASAVQADVSQANKKLILGLALGLGIPFLIAIAAAVAFCVITKRKQYSVLADAVQPGDSIVMNAYPDNQKYEPYTTRDKSKQAIVSVTER